MISVSNDDDDDVEITVRRAASKIVPKSKQLKRDQTKYEPESLCRTVYLQAAKHFSASCQPSHLDSTLSAAMIGNMVTGAVTNKPASLQISL